MHRTLIAGSVIALAAAAAVAAGMWAASPAAAGPRPVPAGPRGDPAAFLTRIVGFVVADEYARAWPSLYPAHQEVAPRDEYVSCERRTPVGWRLRSVTVLRVADRLLRIPGEANRSPAKAVTLRLDFVDAALRTEGAFVHTFHAVPVGSRWTWVLSPSRYELYRTDACGAGETSG